MRMPALETPLICTVRPMARTETRTLNPLQADENKKKLEKSQSLQDRPPPIPAADISPYLTET
jgi:hypothetical protein